MRPALRLALTVALGFVCLYLFTSPVRIDNVDGQARFEVAWSLLWNGSPAPEHADRMSIVMIPGKRAQWISHYGLGHSLLSLPLLEAARLLRGRDHVAAEIAFSLVNPLVAGAVVGIFLLLLVRLGHDLRTAFLSALTLGGASCLWPSAVSVMEGPQVALCLLLLCLAAVPGAAAEGPGAKQAGRPFLQGDLVLAGLAMGWLGITRETDAAAALPLLLVVLLRRRGRRARLRALASVALWGVPFLLVYFGYNLWRYDSLFSLGGRIAGMRESGQPLLGHPLRALLGLTVLPEKGLLFFSPVVVAGLWGWRRLWRRQRPLALAVPAVALLTLLTIVPLSAWRGDWTWGPRYLFGVAPLLLLGLPEVLAVPSRWPRVLVGLVCALGVGVQGAAVAVAHDRYFMKYALDLDYVFDHGAPRPRLASQLFFHLAEALPVAERTMARLEQNTLTLGDLDLYRGLDLASTPMVPGDAVFDKEGPFWAERIGCFAATPFFWIYYDLASGGLYRLPLRFLALMLLALAAFLLGHLAPRLCARAVSTHHKPPGNSASAASIERSPTDKGLPRGPR